MIRSILLTATFFQIIAPCFGQDTIRLEPGYHYTSDKYPLRGKDFSSKVKYAREDIVFSDKRRRIEYCYYYDNERICYGTDYALIGDSTLAIDDGIWSYRKQADKYLMERYYQGTYESGFAKSLVPLETIGLFTTSTADRIDTLWKTDYSADKPSRPGDNPLWAFHKTKITGRIYTKGKIDEPPFLLNGDSLGTIYLKRSPGSYYYGEPLIFVRDLKFIVTREGRIVNIGQGFGNVDMEAHPHYVMDLMRCLLQKGPLRPAKLKGENAAVLWALKVEMNEEPVQK